MIAHYDSRFARRSGWSYEIKLDGYRVKVAQSAGGTTLYSGGSASISANQARESAALLAMTFSGCQVILEADREQYSTLRVRKI